PSTFDMAACKQRRFDMGGTHDNPLLLPRGHMIYAKSSADRCLEHAATACGPQTPEASRTWEHDCASALRGTLAAGAVDCTADAECSEGNYCDLPTSTCRPLKAKGQTCGATNECDYRALGTKDVYCTANDTIPASTGVCADARAVDAVCNTAFQC